MRQPDRPAVQLNGITYRWPGSPVAVICVDGGDPAYFDAALAAGAIPSIAGLMERGFGAVADSVVPSFTNPNNVSIVTGVPPAVHGIPGNYFLEPDTRSGLMMNDPGFLLCDTVLAAFSRAGARVVAISAKDKLRRLLGKGVDLAGGSVNFSAEHADLCTIQECGIEGVLDLVGSPLPDVYSADLSIFVVEAGLKLLERDRPDLMYLSLTDYIQHTFAPGTAEANGFLGRLDAAVGRMAAMGAVVAVTADHGMSDKSNPDGSPRVVYLQDELDARFGEGSARVILPITDPYVIHHGSLGGFAWVYCQGVAPEDVMQLAGGLPGVESVSGAAAACSRFDLPRDRVGDVAVIADGGTALGSTETSHDLSKLRGRLRSHGGVAEQRVPFILSAPLNDEYARRASAERLRNFHIFDYAINGVAS